LNPAPPSYTPYGKYYRHDDKIVIPGVVNFWTMLKFEVIKPLKGVFCIVGDTLVKLSNGID